MAELSARIVLRSAAVAAACLAALAAAAPASAQSSADRRFVITNHTAGEIREFRVASPNGSWSGNWLASRIPGYGGRNLRFNKDRPSACVLNTRVIVDFGSKGMPDDTFHEQPVNYCGLAAINVLDSGLKFDREPGSSRSSSDVRPPRRDVDEVYGAGRSGRPSFQSGDWVLGKWQGGEHWYPGVVESVSGGQVTIRYDDGDRETAPASRVRPYGWRAGQRVECNWKNGGTWYAGRITAIEGERLSIHYDDGDRERTRTSKCRSR